MLFRGANNNRVESTTKRTRGKESNFLAYQARALLPVVAAVRVDRLAEAGLVRGQEAVVVEALLAAERLLERDSVSVRHHVVQDWVDGAVEQKRR